MRQRTREVIEAMDVTADAADFPKVREVSEIYTFGKDGRQRFDPVKNPKLMRK